MQQQCPPPLRLLPLPAAPAAAAPAAGAAPPTHAARRRRRRPSAAGQASAGRCGHCLGAAGAAGPGRAAPAAAVPAAAGQRAARAAAAPAQAAGGKAWGSNVDDSLQSAKCRPMQRRHTHEAPLGLPPERPQPARRQPRRLPAPCQDPVSPVCLPAQPPTSERGMIPCWGCRTGASRDTTPARSSCCSWAGVKGPCTGGGNRGGTRRHTHVGQGGLIPRAGSSL